MLTRKMIVGMIIAVLVSMSTTVWGAHYYVDPNGSDDANGLSWEDAFATIQKGLDTAANGDIVEVNEGTYEETVDFNGVSCTLMSTDPNDPNVVAATIIDASGSGIVVTFNSSEDANSVLRGFTITGGNTGIYCYGPWTMPRITNCIITGNGGTNWGEVGMYCEYSTSPTITNCIFSDNNSLGSYGGGVCSYNSMGKLINCLIAHNLAHDGGGMYTWDSPMTLTNCTFNGNYADNDGGAMYNGGSYYNPTVTNCIFWGNDANGSGDEIYNYSPADPNFSYCDIKGCGGSGNWDPNFGTDGGGNIDADPNFVDPNDPDGQDNVFMTSDDGLTLSSGSPCIDAADNTAVPGNITTDLKGDNRFIDDPNTPDTGNGTAPIVDMGAYEYDPNS